MKRRDFLTGLAGGATLAWLGGAGSAWAQDDDFVYGRELMTSEELAEHRRRMRSLETEQEREAYRQEHHERMEERARERNVKIPDEPGPRGGGMGPGNGPGSGMGSGGMPPRDGSGMGGGMRNGGGGRMGSP